MDPVLRCRYSLLYRAAAIAGVYESDQIGDAPYVTAFVELEEGASEMTNIVIQSPTPENVKVGMPVRVVFDDITDEIGPPKFRPA